MTGGEAMRAEPRLELYWDGLRIEGVRGLVLKLDSDDDLEPQDAELAKVDEIWVFDPKRSDDGRLPVAPAEIGG